MKPRKLSIVANSALAHVAIALALSGAQCGQAIGEITPGFMKGVLSGAIKTRPLLGTLALNPVKSIAIHIKPLHSKLLIGGGATLKESFHNTGTQPASIGFSIPWSGSLQKFSVTGPAQPVERTRLSRWWPGSYRSFMFHTSVAVMAIKGGQVLRRPGVLLPGSIFDMTVPGTYHIRTATGPTKSNQTVIVMLPPNVDNRPLRPFVVPPGDAWPRAVVWGRPWHGLMVRLYQIKSRKRHAETGFRLRVMIRNRNSSPTSIRLVGVAAGDFAKMRIYGPNGIYSNARKGKKVNLTNIPVPLTAYGKLLASGGLAKVKKTSFTLQPRTTYEYAPLIIPNATHDLSLPGRYRLQVELAGTHCWSNVVSLGRQLSITPISPSIGDVGPIRPPVESVSGITARLIPGASGVLVKAQLVDAGAAKAYVLQGPGSGWTLRAFKIKGGRLLTTPRTPKGRHMQVDRNMGMSPPATIITSRVVGVESFPLPQYFVFSAPGKYIVSASRWIGIRGRKQWVRLTTNLLELTLDRAGKATWKTRNVHWPKPVPRKVPPASRLQSSEIPKSCPVAPLAELAAAINQRNVQTVTRAGNKATPSAWPRWRGQGESFSAAWRVRQRL